MFFSVMLPHVDHDLQVRGEAEEKKNVLLSYAATC